MQSKIGLNKIRVEQARLAASNIADDIQNFIEKRTTVSTERTVCRLLGIDGISKVGAPFPNIVVDHLYRKGVLEKGAAWWIGNTICSLNMTPQKIAEAVETGNLDISLLPINSQNEIERSLRPYVEKACNRIKANRKERNERIKCFGGDKSGPYLYLITATGNIYEDVTQAKAAARQGADVVAVIRTTGQSLLDYVPYGATTEGFGGTYATQENFRIMRRALDEVGDELHRYIRLCNYCSGLCMPEIAAMGALERLDMMLNDALYGILFRDINMQRTLVDQYFSRVINSYGGG